MIMDPLALLRPVLRRLRRSADTGPDQRPTGRGTAAPSAETARTWSSCLAAGGLLHERGHPDFRDHFGALCAAATVVDVAVGRIRLGGLDLRPGDLDGVEQLRVVLAEVNALRLAADADAAVSDPERRRNVDLLRRLLREGRLEVRAAPLAGWAPDFSVFHRDGAPRWALIGPHWFQRPYPHPGPAFTSVHGAPEAGTVAVRFQELWVAAHDIGPAVRGVLEGAVQRGGGVPAAPVVQRQDSG